MISPPTILLLDEEPMLRRATALLLTNRGGVVTVAATADEAVALASERLYDVAIFDTATSAVSASEILRRIRDGGLVPRRSIAVVRGGETEGATDFVAVLERPYAFDRLLTAVFGAAARTRTRSGVFPRARATPRAERRVTARPSRAARAGRDRG